MNELNEKSSCKSYAEGVAGNGKNKFQILDLSF